MSLHRADATGRLVKRSNVLGVGVGVGVEAMNIDPWVFDHLRSSHLPYRGLVG